MRRALVLALVVGAALALAGVALAGNGGFAPQTPHSPNAKGINDSFKLIALLTGLIFLLVEGSLIWFVVKYRRRNRPRTAEGPQIHGATRLELMWTALPVVVLAVIAGFVFYKLPGIRDIPAAKAQGGPLTIRVDAHQFYWQFTYPNGAISIDELHVPVHRVVEVDIHSQDVDHSWWVPELGGKFDAIPGRINRTWFKADLAGTYRGQCGEFCGVYHARMLARVVVQSPAQYAAFVASSQDLRVLGGREWRGVCAKCHALDGSGGYGPAINANSVLVETAGLTRILRHGQNILKPVENYMPPVGKEWSSRQIAALQAYMKAHVYKGTSSGG